MDKAAIEREMEEEFLQAKKTCVNNFFLKTAKVIPWKIRSAKGIDVWFGNVHRISRRGITPQQIYSSFRLV